MLLIEAIPLVSCGVCYGFEKQVGLHSETFIGPAAVVADWESEAEAVCKAKEREADTNPLIKMQCKVRCTKQGEISTFENLPDGTECERIIFRSTKGSCKDGLCQ